jgi:hypothetical protein
MNIRDKEKTRVFVLHPNKIAQGTKIVSQMQIAR